MAITANVDLGNVFCGLVAAGSWFSAHRAHKRAIEVDDKLKTMNGKTIGQLADETAARVEKVAEVLPGVIENP